MHCVILVLSCGGGSIWCLLSYDTSRCTSVYCHTTPADVPVDMRWEPESVSYQQSLEQYTPRSYFLFPVFGPSAPPLSLFPVFGIIALPFHDIGAETKGSHGLTTTHHHP